MSHLNWMRYWGAGYTRDEIDQAQERYGFRFPPDLCEFFAERSPLEYDWRIEDPRIRKMLDWPFDMLWFDVEHGSWWPDWGERPNASEARREVLIAALRDAPRLIPLHFHRFLPETPHEVGNPVFSMRGFDTVYFGADLEDYFKREFVAGNDLSKPVNVKRRVSFWSDIAEDMADPYLTT